MIDPRNLKPTKPIILAGDSSNENNLAAIKGAFTHLFTHE